MSTREHSSASTLTTLALLKVQVDKGGDYLDYLKPFTQHILATRNFDQITADGLRQEFISEYGLTIPIRTLQIVLQRFCKPGLIRKERGVFVVAGSIGDCDISKQRADAARRIRSVVSGFIAFANTDHGIQLTEEQAGIALIDFISEFGISCIRSFLTGSSLPQTNGSQKDKFLVSRYLVLLNDNDPDKFDDFMVLVQGNMLSNALLCPDLKGNASGFNSVTFFFDTPVILSLMGLEGDHPKNLGSELLCLLRNMSGRIAVMTHTIVETAGVIRNAAEGLSGNTHGSGSVYFEAKRKGMTRSDLLLIAADLEARLKSIGFTVADSGIYDKETQIDERHLELVLQDGIHYQRENARINDVKSIRYIHNLRRGISPISIEQSKAILITNNHDMVRIVRDFSQEYSECENVPPAVTDVTIANYAWLKSPVGAPALPSAEVMAYAYAALRPSDELLRNFLAEVDKLSADPNISANSISLLRSDIRAIDAAVSATLGDDKAITGETVKETLRRVTAEIVKSEQDKLTAEEIRHKETKDLLRRAREEKMVLRRDAFWRANRYADAIGTLVFTVLLIVAVAGVLNILVVDQFTPWSFLWIIPLSVYSIFSLLNLVNGLSIMDVRGSLAKWTRSRLLRREYQRLRIPVSEIDAPIDATMGS